MNDFIEQLESRTLFSTAFAAAGEYKGPAIPVGKTSQTAIIAAVGTKKIAGKLSADLQLNIANNDIVTGTLTIAFGKPATVTVGSYVLSGLVVGADVNVTIESTGKTVGTFDGTLKALNKKLIGPFTDTVNGQTVTGQFNLINQASVKPPKGTSNSSNNLALVPGFIPNQTPPPITTGAGNGDQTGITGGDNSGTGIISDGGSLLG